MADLKVIVDRNGTPTAPTVLKTEKGERGDKGEPGPRGPSGLDVSVTKGISEAYGTNFLKN